MIFLQLSRYMRLAEGTATRALVKLMVLELTKNDAKRSFNDAYGHVIQKLKGWPKYVGDKRLVFHDGKARQLISLLSACTTPVRFSSPDAGEFKHLYSTEIDRLPMK